MTEYKSTSEIFELVTSGDFNDFNKTLDHYFLNDFENDPDADTKIEFLEEMLLEIVKRGENIFAIEILMEMRKSDFIWLRYLIRNSSNQTYLLTILSRVLNLYFKLAVNNAIILDELIICIFTELNEIEDVDFTKFLVLFVRLRNKDYIISILKLLDESNTIDIRLLLNKLLNISEKTTGIDRKEYILAIKDIYLKIFDSLDQYFHSKFCIQLLSDRQLFNRIQYFLIENIFAIDDKTEILDFVNMYFYLNVRLSIFKRHFEPEIVETIESSFSKLSRIFTDTGRSERIYAVLTEYMMRNSNNIVSKGLFKYGYGPMELTIDIDVMSLFIENFPVYYLAECIKKYDFSDYVMRRIGNFNFDSYINIYNKLLLAEDYKGGNSSRYALKHKSGHLLSSIAVYPEIDIKDVVKLLNHIGSDSLYPLDEEFEKYIVSTAKETLPDILENPDYREIYLERINLILIDIDQYKSVRKTLRKLEQKGESSPIQSLEKNKLGLKILKEFVDIYTEIYLVIEKNEA